MKLRIRRVLQVAWAFFLRDLKIEYSYKLGFVLQVFALFPPMFTFFFLSTAIEASSMPLLSSYGGDYFSFVLVGMALQSYMGLSLTSFSRRIRDAQLKGTLELIFSTPISPSLFLFSSFLFDFALNSLRVFLIFASSAVLLDVSLCWEQVMALALCYLLAMASFTSIGIMSASFVLIFKRGDPLAWLLGTSSSLFAGVYYPVAVLPSGLQWLAQALPSTHAIELMRQLLINNASTAELWPQLAALVGWTAISMPCALAVFKRALRRAREDSSLAHY